MRCSLDEAKRGFYTAANSIFGKIAAQKRWHCILLNLNAFQYYCTA